MLLDPFSNLSVCYRAYGKMVSNSVSLAWNGHYKMLVSVFEKLLENSHLVDCTITAEGQRMKAHTEVLSAFSPFFELLFREETENNPSVIISGISFRDLRTLIDFMYQGKLEVTVDRIHDLIAAAECLQIKGIGSDDLEAGAGNINNTMVDPKTPALPSDIPNKRTRRAVREERARVFPKECDVHNVNFSNKPHMNSDLVTCVAQETSVPNLIPSSDVQNVAIVSNISMMPAQSTLSEIEMDSLHLQGESMGRIEPELDEDRNISEPMGDTTRKEPVCGNIETSNVNSGEMHSLDLPPDISVPSERNVCEDRLLDSAPPAVLSSQSCSRDLTTCSVNNELGTNNVNLRSETVDSVVSVVDTQDPLFHSEFHIKADDESLLSVDNDLISEQDEFSENMPVIIGVSSASDMQMKVVCTERKDDCSGAAPGWISASTYTPQELPAAFVRIQRITALGLMPGPPAKVNSHDPPTPPSNTTPACEEDLSGPSGRDVGDGSGSTDQQFRCQICGKAFTRNQHLKVHMRIHAEDGEFRKDECNNTAITSVKLTTRQSGRKLYKCTVCNFKSLHPSALSKHKKIHSGEKPYNCAECGYSTSRRDHLIQHVHIHSKVKPYKCKECDYTANKIDLLKRHSFIHGGTKHLKCADCDYRTAHISDFNRHRRMHSGARPFKCTECEYVSAYSSNLKKHQHRHRRPKP